MDRRLRPGIVAAVAACGLLGIALGLLAPASQAAPAAQRNNRETPCRCPVTKALGVDALRTCETSPVTVTLSPACPGTLIHIVYIIDEVYKPGFSEPRDRYTALRNSINRLELDENPHIRVGIVWMQRGRATRRLALTNEPGEIYPLLDIPPVSRFDTPTQCFDCGFREAIRVLDEGERDFPDDPIDEIVLLAPLGVYAPAAAPGVRRGAQMAKSRGATVISTCFAWTHCDAVLRRAASSPRLYLKYGEGNRLAALITDVVRESVSAFVRSVTLTEHLPEGIDYVPDSAQPPPSRIDADGRSLVWEIDDAEAAVYTMTYRVQPAETGVGSYDLGADSRVVLVDSLYREMEIPVPAPRLTVTERCLVEPSPTPPPPPTDTPVPPTPVPPTDTPEPTAIPTATPTPRPGPIYLPISIRERCRPESHRADVVLVMDASSSMRELTRTGRTKLDAAAEAAGLLVDRLDFTPDGEGKADQAGVVAFHHAASVVVPLGRDPTALHAGLADLQVDYTTRLDLGITRGLEALFGPARDARNQPVLIVLTDGRANPVPVEVAVERAAAAKARDVTLYTVALGPDVDSDALRAMASRPSAYHRAPDGEDLGAIYTEITDEVACRADPFWPALP